MSVIPSPPTRALCRSFLLLLICLLPGSTTAQEKREIDELNQKPIFVTARIFQIRVKKGSSQEVSDQLFKIRSFSNQDQWSNAFKKSYPGQDIALLRTESRRVFRTSKPTIISLNKLPDGSRMEIHLYGSHSQGEGQKLGTNLFADIGLHSGSDLSHKPITYSVQPIEVESGMTYFYTNSNLKLSSADYVKHIRSTAPAGAFDGDEFYLLFAYTVNLEKPAEPARYLDEPQSMKLQNEATKKVIPEVPARLGEAKLGGFIRVRVEVSPEGRVTSANIHYSSFPEINNEALAAARQWEFPTTLFTENKNPITGFITFSFATQSD
jgi:TonB family protein